MQKYNFITKEYYETEVLCEECGEVINGSKGMKTCYREDKNGVKNKIVLGSCCAGKINAYGVISKNIKEAYKSKGQISEEVLKRLPLAPKPLADPKKSGSKIDNFIDTIGRSKLSKSENAKIKYKKNKSLKDLNV